MTEKLKVTTGRREVVRYAEPTEDHLMSMVEIVPASVADDVLRALVAAADSLGHSGARHNCRACLKSERNARAAIANATKGKP